MRSETAIAAVKMAARNSRTRRDRARPRRTNRFVAESTPSITFVSFSNSAILRGPNGLPVNETTHSGGHHMVCSTVDQCYKNFHLFIWTELTWAAVSHATLTFWFIKRKTGYDFAYAREGFVLGGFFKGKVGFFHCRSLLNAMDSSILHETICSRRRGLKWQKIRLPKRK